MSSSSKLLNYIKASLNPNGFTPKEVGIGNLIKSFFAYKYDRRISCEMCKKQHAKKLHYLCETCLLKCRLNNDIVEWRRRYPYFLLSENDFATIIAKHKKFRKCLGKSKKSFMKPLNTILIVKKLK
jgi:hypothetical protein